MTNQIDELMQQIDRLISAVEFDRDRYHAGRPAGTKHQHIAGLRQALETTLNPKRPTRVGPKPMTTQVSRLLASADKMGDHTLHWTEYVQAREDFIVALEAALNLGGEPFGWYFSDDPKVFAMPGSGFKLGKEPPNYTVGLIPLYTAPPLRACTRPTTDSPS